MAGSADVVTLSSLTADHAEATLRWFADPFLMTNLGTRGRPSIERTQAFIARATTDESIEARAILLGATHVGNVVLDAIDRTVQKARLHIYVGEPSARGKGVARRALSLILADAFGPLGLGKVFLTVHAKNAPAIAAYVAVGFELEGVHREEFLLDGERVSELYMGCLAADFAKVQTRREARGV